MGCKPSAQRKPTTVVVVGADDDPEKSQQPKKPRPRPQTPAPTKKTASGSLFKNLLLVEGCTNFEFL